MQVRQIAVLAAGAAVAALAAVAAPAAAGASAGGTFYASCATNDGGACAGRVISGTNFRSITTRATLPDPNQFADVTDGVGWQVGLKATVGTTTYDGIIGISDVPNSGAGYSPQSLWYVNGSLSSPGAVAPNAVWCAAGQPCAPASAGGAFPVGATVTLSVVYNQPEGTINYDAWDTAGDYYKAQLFAGHSVVFGQARVEAGYGSFTAPPTSQKLVNFLSTAMTAANGSHYTLGSALSSTVLAVDAEDGTSDGTSATPVQAAPGPVSKGAFIVAFKP